MKTAVKRFIGINEKEANEVLKKYQCFMDLNIDFVKLEKVLDLLEEKEFLLKL